MSRRRTILMSACLAASAAGLLSPLSPSIAFADQATVEKLVADLDSPQWPVRHRAERDLSKLGAADLPHLKAALKALPADATEARLRLGRVIGELSVDSLAGATRCDLALNGVDGHEAVAELARRAGVELSAHSRLPGYNLSLEADGDFWPTLLGWCRGHGWDVNFSSGGPQNLSATVVAAGQSQNGLSGFAHASGAALFTVRGSAFEKVATFNRVDAVDTDRTAREQTFTYELAAHLEPRFQIGDRRFAIEWTDARDATGRSLLPWRQEAMVADAGMMMGGLGEREPAPAAGASKVDDDHAATQVFEWRSGRLPFEVKLIAADPSRLGSVTLSGRLKGLVGAELRDVEADLMTDGSAEWQVAGEPVLVRLDGPEPVSRSGRNLHEWRIVFESLRPLPESLERLVITSLSNASLSTQGSRFRRGATRTRRGDDGRVEYSIDFLTQVGDTPETARCRIPAEAVELDLPFEFKNLPTP